MSYTRTYNWSCDHPDCAPIGPECREEPGLPKGWISTVARLDRPDWTVVKHFCQHHRNTVPRDLWHPLSLEKYPP